MRPGYKREFARQLRRGLTDAERSLWFYLRNRALLGCKFRRQYPVGPYIVDFACVERRVVVELDGAQHADSIGDPARTAFLEAHGYRVLRFWNHEALIETPRVLDAIHRALAEPCPTSPPSPQPLSRERERG